MLAPSSVIACTLALLAPLCSAAGLRDEPICGAVLQYLDGADWTLSSSNGSTVVPATVPGDLLSDLQRAGIIGDPLFGDNLASTTTAALALDTWTWSTTFDLDPDFLAQTGGPGGVLLVLDSVKLAADVTLNGAALISASDQFLRYNATVPPGLLRPVGNVLAIASPPLSDTRNSAGRFMACAAGWDWAPQPAWGPMTRGVVRSVYLVAAPSVALTHLSPLVFYTGPYPTVPLTDAATAGPWNVSVRVHLASAAAPGSAAAAGTLTVSGGWPGAAPVSLPVSVPAGAEAVASATLVVPPGAVALWWPAGLGAQPLYSVTATFTPGSGAAPASPPVSVSRRIGFRTLALVTDDDSEPARLAGVDGSGNLTMRWRVNGASVWARGANMIPMEDLDARSSTAALEALVQACAQGLGGGEERLISAPATPPRLRSLSPPLASIRCACGAAASSSTTPSSTPAMRRASYSTTT